MRAMKRPWLILAVSILFAAISCAGSTSSLKEDPLDPARKELHKGITWYQQGCYHNALPHLLRSHEMFTAYDNLPGIAMSLNNIGNVYGKLDDPESAILFFESSQAIYRDLDDIHGTAQALSNQAAVLIKIDNLEDAEATLEAAQKLLDRNGGKNPLLLNNWGVLLTREKAYTEAEKMPMEALAAADPENHVQAASIHYSLGSLMSTTGRYDRGSNTSVKRSIMIAKPATTKALPMTWPPSGPCISVRGNTPPPPPTSSAASKSMPCWAMKKRHSTSWKCWRSLPGRPTSISPLPGILSASGRGGKCWKAHVNKFSLVWIPGQKPPNLFGALVDRLAAWLENLFTELFL